ncbi:MAG: septal ring lytic transglycosylase RlpA family protein [Chlorobium sp.]|jgi:rare lipoprotein A|uniref:septal ring lytic transglycosylase RlpA family protein n=1 Tax=Chlorobium sp. TaxID=1095 RepID=UPI001D83E3C7|nr:septal ring lytic transglycosylase RlpA family protein [Chlorobium sp.]MBN1278486.1 septal ring lytic transglycosylase RlpA family protein [Chlorobiaceae bacterium]MCF8215525.1 septal ring lytic transglycosylase RlpA family protein [Chlorobium sp.]MCF8270421.1 septal ring lytic transglycosylase RlpA family protein [Chlorobium sp.]MCF8286791.1 septal ring lytic transglycosylase RlpA family protein [Chlorobium sp.]MCF8290313.1 septal ring lytic transglycosylase RlpA family protein [Chlorobium
MRHRNRFFSLTLLSVLTGLICAICQPNLTISGITKLTDATFLSIAHAASGNDRTVGNDLMLVSEGKASYYANQFHGRKTANGETFNMNEMTAAHRTLPFGTWVRVTNLRNGKDVIVRINDRGPFIKGRVIDLSKQAAKEIGLMKAGTANVRVEAIDPSSEEHPG